MVSHLMTSSRGKVWRALSSLNEEEGEVAFGEGRHDSERVTVILTPLQVFNVQTFVTKCRRICVCGMF